MMTKSLIAVELSFSHCRRRTMFRRGDETEPVKMYAVLYQRLTTRRERLLAGSFFLLLALIMWAHVWITGSPFRTLPCSCGDATVQVWWFEWIARAIATGANPLFPPGLFAHLGTVNALANTSDVSVGVILTPLTWLAGPLMSANVANLLTPVLSALSAYCLAARLTESRVARTVAGLLYGFSPYMIHFVERGDTNLTLVIYLPLMLMALDNLRRYRWSARRTGLTMTAYTVLQFFTGTEFLLMAIMAIATVLLAVTWWRRDVLIARVDARIAAMWWLTTSALLLSVPAWIALLGPGHVEGALWLASTTPPSTLISHVILHKPDTATAWTGYLGFPGAQMNYIGIGALIIALAGWGLVARRRLLAIWWLTATVFVVAELSPATWWVHLPIAKALIIQRFAVVVSLALALIIALVIDATTERLRVQWAPSVLAPRLAVAAVVAVVLLPIATTYRFPLTVTSQRTPVWFTKHAAEISPDTTVVVFPFPWIAMNASMAWMAETGLHGKLVGGFAMVPGKDGKVSSMAAPTPTENALLFVSYGPRFIQPQQLRALGVTLHRWAPTIVVVIRKHASPDTITALTSILGSPTSVADGATVWNITT